MKNPFKYIGAWASQVGGKHYKEQAIQTMHFSMANNLNALEHSIVKYVLRKKHDDIDIDLDKAIQCIEMLRQWRNGTVFTVEQWKEMEELTSVITESETEIKCVNCKFFDHSESNHDNRKKRAVCNSCKTNDKFMPK